MATTPSIPSASFEARLDIPEGICVLTYRPLDVQAIVQSVQDSAAGAIGVFIGITRNSFKEKVVTRLDYQAYTKLAIKTVADIVRNAHGAYTRSEHRTAHIEQPAQSLNRSAVHHRLGTVPVGEPSIVIAVSSPHRKEAFMACERILEDVKLKAQIWKREFYEGEREEEAEWKGNVDH